MSDMFVKGPYASQMAPATPPPAFSLASIRRQIALVRQQNKVLIRELKALQREVPDLIRIRAEVIARSQAFERDVQKRLEEIRETFQQASAA